MKVDPGGLAVVAQRIGAALTDVSGGDPVHPPLSGDPASAGAAVRLSTAGSVLAETIAQHAAGLMVTAEQLGRTGAGLAAADEAVAADIAALSPGSGIPGISGWAPAAPPMPPDLRPPIPPPAPMPGEILAAAVHSGDPGGGQSFITEWKRVASTVGDAAVVARSVANGLPDVWDSPVSTEHVRAHLMGYANGLESAAARAYTLGDQAAEHGEQNGQARADVPPPELFDAVNEQMNTVAGSNAPAAVKLAALTQLAEQKNQLEGQAAEGYGSYHAATDAATSGDGDPGADGTDAADDVGADEGIDPSIVDVPSEAGSAAGVLPSMIPAVLGAVGGAAGGALGAAAAAPNALMNAGMQAGQAALQGLGNPEGEKPEGGEPEDEPDDEDGDESSPGDFGGAGAGSGGGDGATTPAAGGGAPPLPVAVSAGPPPTAPSIPAGGASAATSDSAGMPMGMPMGAPMGGNANGGGKGASSRSKTLATVPAPGTLEDDHELSLRLRGTRVAVSATAPPEPTEPQPPEPPQPAGVVVRRITLTTKDDDD